MLRPAVGPPLPLSPTRGSTVGDGLLPSLAPSVPSPIVQTYANLESHATDGSIGSVRVVSDSRTKDAIVKAIKGSKNPTQSQIKASMQCNESD